MKLSLANLLRSKYHNYVIVKRWKKQGKPFPPPHLVKQQAINKQRRKFDYEILVESGTYLGDMVEAQKKHFKKVYSIELGKELHLNAVRRFENDKNVEILYGDSGIVLHNLVPQIDKPAIFWLDGHYSAGITARGEKDCPIFEELNAILKDKKFNHLIMIDDARLFVGTNDYPTVSELNSFLAENCTKFNFIIENDIIQIELIYR